VPSDVAVRVRDLSKVYRIPSVQLTQGDGGVGTWHRKRIRLKRASRESFEALRGINLEVPEGEVCGIIGRNGAGKSTLLKVLSRITNPSSGQVDLYGRVGCLLEVGTGFHPELTGRENVYLSGAILGMKRREIDARFDSIVDFAETSAFLDTPVKRYSSGMYVRLAFAVAAHLEPEILIVDEVLAVGDAAFQKKCLNRMQDASSREGRTVLFVSHNMTAIESICSRGILIEAGQIAFDGTSREAVDAYLSSGVADASASAGEYDLVDVERGSDVTKRIFKRVTIRDGEGKVTGAIRMGDALSITVDLERDVLRHQGIDVRIVTDSDRPVVNLHSHMKRLVVHDERAHWDQVILTIPKVPLVPGTYWISLTVRDGAKVAGRKVTLDRVDRAAGFEVHPADVFGTGFQMGTGPDHGVVFIDQHWEAMADGGRVAATEGF